MLIEWLDIIAPAWVAGSLLALLSAPLGCLVLWRRMSFFADALAHGTLFGVALAALWQLPFAIGIALVSVMVVISLLWLDFQPASYWKFLMFHLLFVSSN